jgi:hypothetical protein
MRLLVPIAFVLASCAAQPPARAPVQHRDATAVPPRPRADYAIVAPRRFFEALAPLAKHREAQGHVVTTIAVEDVAAHPDSEAIRAALRGISSLKFAFLVGDTRHPSDADVAEVPTFYLPKLAYENHSHEHHAPYADARADHDTYPTDFPYGDVGEGRVVAVGRLPARTVEDVRGFVRKVIDYESAPATGAWRRRVSVVAGPANFGTLADGMIESIATEMLDHELSYDYDVTFTFAKADSPYAFPFDKLRERFVRDMGDGALVAGYVGHGAFDTLDWARFGYERWDIARAEDAEALRIGAGKPLFFSIACNTGAYDRPFGRASLAERMILNADGPIGVFASSRESHPYPNALYGKAIVTELVNRHPRTIGEGVAAVRKAMKNDDIPFAALLVGVDTQALKREHEGLYNLLGDPATPLRYPDSVVVTAPPSAAPSAPITIDVRAQTKGTRVLVTVETRRRAMKEMSIAPAKVPELPRDRAFSAMSENYAKANDKVITRADAPFADGRATASLTAPREPGEYVIKVLVVGEEATGAGHATLRVAP